MRLAADDVGDVVGHGRRAPGSSTPSPPRPHHLGPRAGPRQPRQGGRVRGRSEWAITSGASVVNLSLSSRSEDYHALLHDIVEDAYFANVLFVCAANNVRGPSYPSLFSSVVSVAAHDVADPDVWFYNPRPPVEFAALGWTSRSPGRRRPPGRDGNSLRPRTSRHTPRASGQRTPASPRSRRRRSSPERRPTHAEPTHGRSDEPDRIEDPLHPKRVSARSGGVRYRGFGRPPRGASRSAVAFVSSPRPSVVRCMTCPRRRPRPRCSRRLSGLPPGHPDHSGHSGDAADACHPGHRGRHQAMPLYIVLVDHPMAQALTPASLAGSLLICTHVRSPSDSDSETAAILRINAQAASMRRTTPQVSTGRQGRAQRSARGRARRRPRSPEGLA